MYRSVAVEATGEDKDKPPQSTVETPSKPGDAAPAWTTAVEPKPLSENVRKGLAWLAEHQLPGGGWSQGEESPQMGGGEAFRDKPDVADTCIAALALVRAGNSPREGPYKDALAKAVGFVRAEVEAADAKSLAVTSIQGTRVQMKLGPNVDTFLASLLLAEVKGKMPDEPANQALDLALAKVVDKIKKNLKADGTWDNTNGWAPVLAESLGSKGLNRAQQNGVLVANEVLTKIDQNAQGQFAMRLAARPAAGAPSFSPSGRISAGAASIPGAGFGGGAGAGAAPAAIGASGLGGAGAGAAGVELYDRAANIAFLSDSVNSSVAREAELKKTVETSKDGDAVTAAKRGLGQIAESRRTFGEAQGALLGRLDDAQFVAGFGSNGGEEFLSYMNISEGLVVKGGLDWKRWDDAMASNLNRIQNSDGSWTGHHCITGRTFCTSTALLVLLADRTPVPVTAKSKAESK
jgi:hypothetical protein